MADYPIYMDNHSTTRVDPRVLDAMLPYFSEKFGNAGSTSHRFGWEAREAVDRARESIAAAIGAQPREIVFTSGATESNNLALFGVVERARQKSISATPHIISVATEHKSILDPLAHLAHHGCEVTLLPVEQAGSPAQDLSDRASGRRNSREYGAGNRDACEQRNRRDPADCRNCRGVPSSAVCHFTATPRKPSAKSV